MKNLSIFSILMFCLTLLTYSQNDCPPDINFPTLKGQIVKWWLNEASMADLYFRNQYGGPWLSRSEYTAIVRSAVRHTMVTWSQPSGVQFIQGSYEDHNLEITFQGLGSTLYGHYQSGLIEIDNGDSWTGNPDIVRKDYADIYTVLVHEMGHAHWLRTCFINFFKCYVL